MLAPKTISELNKAFLARPQGFTILEEGRPKFVVLDYPTYLRLKKAKPEKRPMQKVLVTGGAGYIGSHTVKLLLESGYEVVVYDNLSTGHKERLPGGSCELVIADLADRESLDRVLKQHQVDAVVHFAASVEAEESVHNPSKYFQNNVINGLNLLDAMVSHAVSKIVFSSSAAVYGETTVIPLTELSPCRPTNPYGESKLIFEKILKWYAASYGLHSMSLRYFNAAGAAPEYGLGYNHPGEESHLIPRILNVALGKTSELEIFGQNYQTPDGTCVRDYVHVMDVAKSHVLALQKLATANGAYVYNVGSGIGYSVLEVIDAAVEITGRMIPMKFAARRPGDPSRLVADVSKIQKDFGWQPKHDLKSILETAWAWQKKDYHKINDRAFRGNKER